MTFCHAQMSRIFTFFSFVRNGPYPLPAEKNFASPPRELQCSDRAQTLTTGSGRPSCVDVRSVSAKSARAKRYDRKPTKKSPNISILMHSCCFRIYKHISVDTFRSSLTVGEYVRTRIYYSCCVSLCGHGLELRRKCALTSGLRCHIHAW